MATVKEFIEQYNERIDWNNEIRDYVCNAFKNFKFDVFNTHLKVKQIFDSRLPTEKIIPEKYTISTAIVVKYQEYPQHELQIYEKGSEKKQFFWLVMNTSKDEYIQGLLHKIIEEVTSEFNRLINRTYDIQWNIICMNTLLQELNQLKK